MPDKESEDRPKSKLWTPEGGAPQSQEPAEEQEELSEEEMRRRIEEAMERITVADIVLDMMISLSSLAYQRMGLPAEVNEKYKDMEQARMAIDCLDAMASSIEGRVADDLLSPLSDTISNLKMNFAKES